VPDVLHIWPLGHPPALLPQLLPHPSVPQLFVPQGLVPQTQAEPFQVAPDAHLKTQMSPVS